jgi:hypothetical protein
MSAVVLRTALLSFLLTGVVSGSLSCGREDVEPGHEANAGAKSRDANGRMDDGASGRVDDGANGSVAEPAVTPLRPGMDFPDVSLTSLDGRETDARSLLESRDSVILFLQVGCEVCEEVLEVWMREKDAIPESLHVLAILEEEPAFASRYAEGIGIPFPLYCDEHGTFGTRYKIRVFPSAVGVTARGRVAFVGKPVTPEFTPMRAWGFLRQAKAGKEG